MYEEIEVRLFNSGAVKFGSYKLKCGAISPIYVDLRGLISDSFLIKDLCALINERLLSVHGDCYKKILVCGVPYAALHIASGLSLLYDIPLIIKRKEAKEYGTSKLIEGVYSLNDECIIIEDVITSGSSIIETRNALRNLGLIVRHAFVVIDREQGGARNLLAEGIQLHKLFGLKSFVKNLSMHNLISQEQLDDSLQFLTNNKPKFHDISYVKSVTQCPFNVKLSNIIQLKKTRIAVAADLGTTSQIMELVDRIGPFICLLKTHIDAIEDFTLEFLDQLKKKSIEHNFLLLEDRKFSDIGNTVLKQVTCSYFSIAKYFDAITINIFSGDGILKALSTLENPPACLLLAEMSTVGNLYNKDIENKCLESAETYNKLVSGFICQKRVDTKGRFLHFTPGVAIPINDKQSRDKFDQQYKTPEAVLAGGTDVLIVGRAIVCQDNQAKAAQLFRDVANADFE